MPLRKPRKGETQAEFLSYCMHELAAEGDPDRPQEQRLAICFRAWRDRKRDDHKSNAAELIDLLEELANKAYDPGQPRALDSGRWVGSHDNIYSTPFAQYHTCPSCGFKWTTKRGVKR